MEIVKEYLSVEENIKGSRFLSELFPCESQSEAREIIKSQKEKYSDSTHVVHAFVVGKNAEIMGMSDDGEPSGTAGRPALDVLKGRKCTNTLLTITRWFGGTLLGTGGLVKAYSSGAKKVLEKADSENKIEELIEKKDFSFCTNYSLYKIIKNNLKLFDIYDLQEDFQTEITLKGKIRQNQYESFVGKMLDLSDGKIKIK